MNAKKTWRDGIYEVIVVEGGKYRQRVYDDQEPNRCGCDGMIDRPVYEYLGQDGAIGLFQDTNQVASSRLFSSQN